MAPQGRLLQIRYDSQIHDKNLVKKEGKLESEEIKKDQKQVQRLKSPHIGTKIEQLSTTEQGPKASHNTQSERQLTTRGRSFSCTSAGIHPTIIVTEDAHSEIRNTKKYSVPQFKANVPRLRSRTCIDEVDYTTIQTITPHDNEKTLLNSPKHSPSIIRKYSFSDMEGTNLMKNQKFTDQKRSLDSLHPGSFTQAPSKSCEDLRKISRSYFSVANARTPEPKRRTSVYEEEPFYLRPQKTQHSTFRRRSWQFGQTHSFDKDIVDDNEIESVSEHHETQSPLSEILPPITLPSIYAQECMKQKATQKKKQQKQGSKKESSNSVENLTKNLLDCRYLRIPNSKLSVQDTCFGW